MKILAYGLGITAAGFLGQVLVWRLRMPLRQTRAMGILFIPALALGLAVAWKAPPPWNLENPFAMAHAGLFAAAFWAAWVISYSALEAQSPTLVMAERIAGAAEEGVDQEDFFREMDDELLVLPRLEDLVRDNLAERRGNVYVLTRKGRALAGLMAAWRKLLGAGMGG
ncbi:MAG: hypothetical protein JRI97_08850 [Deltaproteobacteria bacterium]|nr:hypothetical protein [Deltaproteobacteria bacterium]